MQRKKILQKQLNKTEASEMGREFNTEKNTKQCIRQFQPNYQKRTLNNSNLNSLCNVIKTTKTSPSHKLYRVIFMNYICLNQAC